MCILVTACGDAPLVVGDVSAVESGNGKVEISACIEVAGESCAKSPMDITLVHAGTETTMPYGGFIFAAYRLTVAGASAGHKKFPVCNRRIRRSGHIPCVR